MKRFILFLLTLFSFSTFAQFPDESDPHRGVYVDRFAKRLQGFNNIYDPEFSILGADLDKDGIFEKEDSLLRYCAENHITDIELYDLEKIFGGTLTAWNENTKMFETLEQHLCRFMQKARNEYCITEIGAAGSTAYNFDSVAAFNDRYPITDAYRLRNDQRNAARFDTTLNMVERTFAPDDPQRVKAEILKYCLRTADFNSCNPCGARFDNINSEFEFWYACANDLEDFQTLLFAMNSIKQMYNANHPDHKLRIETYIASLNSCPNMTDVLNFLDGCNNCAPCSTCTSPHERLVDRLLYAQQTANGAYYSYYVQNLFEAPQTGDSSDFHPLQYAGGIHTSSGADYLGPWFELSPYYTIFSAELNFYNSYRNHPDATFWSNESNNIQPGGTLWFAASHMVNFRDNPMIIQNAGPYCSYNQPVNISFIYVGPEDPGMEYEFYVTRDSDGAVVYPQGGGMITGTSSAFIPSTANTPFHPAIDFTDTLLFPPLALPSGIYTSHLTLYYDHHSGCSYTSEHPLVIVDKPAIQIIGDTTFCNGGYTWLKASAGGSGYQWYKDGKAIPYATTRLQRVTEGGDYYCDVSAWTMCDGFTDTVHIHVRQLTQFYVNATCHGNGTVTLKANHDPADPNSTNQHGHGGMTYLWNTGEVTDQITVPTGGSTNTYRLVMTNPYTGCSMYKDMRVPSTPNNAHTASITITTPPSSSCSSDGVLMANLNPYPGAVSYLWSTGQTTTTISGVSPGPYSVVQSVWNNACSYYATINVGTLPADSPSVSAAITNVSCQGINDGAIDLTVSGLHPPYRYVWREIPDEGSHDPNDEDQSDLYAGTYHVSIFDSGGCEFKRSFFVAPPANTISLSTSYTSVTQCADDATGTASVVATGGNNPYSYLWNDPAAQTSSTASGLYAGSYSVTVTDANGCTTSEYVSVPREVTPLTSNLMVESITVLNCDTSVDGILFVDICGGTEPYSFNGAWTYDSIAHLENLSPGMYPMIVTDANGCITSDSFLVTAPASLNMALNLTHTTCIGCPDGSIEVVAGGGSPPYAITWSGTNGILNGNVIENLPAGIYEVCITDSLNCISCRTDTVFDDPMWANELEQNGFIIYPNPFNQTATLFLHHLPASCIFTITDLTGRKVMEMYPVKKETTFGRKNLDAGVYNYELTGKDFPARMGKLVVY